MNSVTCGKYKLEKEAENRLRDLIEISGLFTAFEQVYGYPEYKPHYKKTKEYFKIDFLLTPKAKLVNAGWKYGAIGIECKASDTKIGKPISQILDYSSAIYRHPLNTVLIKPDFIFLWPLEKVHGDVASIMAQNRFGSACESGANAPWHSLRFYCGEQKILNYQFDNHKIEINTSSFGKRLGSR